MLTHLTIENFKSWRKADVAFAPLTIIFGANSSGKSSLIQFLLLLKQTKESTDRALALDFGEQEGYVNLGSFKDAVFNHDEQNRLSWSLNWNQQDELKIVDPEGDPNKFRFRSTEFNISSTVGLHKKRAPVAEKLVYKFNGVEFALDSNSDGGAYKLNSDHYKFARTLGRPWDLPGPIKSYAFPDQVRTYYKNSLFLSDFENAYERQIDKILYLGPLREFPKREYIWAGSSPNDVGRRGERVVDAIMAATAKSESRNLKHKAKYKSFQEMIAFWLKEMGLINQFRIDEVGKLTGLYRVHVKRDAKSAETLITDVGFGVSQILPVLVLLYYVPEGSTVVLEQPEIHLHPSVQSALADLIITVVKHRKVQVIVESHSEHLLQRLTRRIAEGSSSPYPEISINDVKAYFCSSENGESYLKDLELDIFGRIINWPIDFFGDSFGDIAAREKAALKNS